MVFGEGLLPYVPERDGFSARLGQVKTEAVSTAPETPVRGVEVTP